MAKRRKAVQFYEYECTITGEKFKRYKKVKDTDDLVSVSAYYELNPEKDDRPDNIKAKLAAEAEEKKKMEEMLDLFE